MAIKHDMDVILTLELNLGSGYDIEMPDDLDVEAWEEALVEWMLDVESGKAVSIPTIQEVIFRPNKP